MPPICWGGGGGEPATEFRGVIDAPVALAAADPRADPARAVLSDIFLARHRVLSDDSDSACPQRRGGRTAAPALVGAVPVTAPPDPARPLRPHTRPAVGF